MIIEFESIEKALEFYESETYHAALKIREKAANTNLYLVEGI